MAAVNSRGVKKISGPARNVNLVVDAMRKLGDENGSTVGNIVGYLSECYEKPAPKRQVIAALKRGIEFGIVDRRRGRYFLNENEKRHGRLSRFEDGNSATASTRGRGTHRVAGVGTRTGGGRGARAITAGGVGDAGGTTSTELHERDARTRKHSKPKRDRKSKDAARRKKNSKKLSGRKAMKRTRFARSLHHYNLNEHYKNPSYKTSAVSSIESMDCYESED